MTQSNDDAEPLRRPAEGEEPPLFEAVSGLLLRVLTRKFGVPPEDAQSLLQEAYVSYLSMQGPPHDARAWLIAAACINAKAYQERHGLSRGEAGAASDESRAPGAGDDAQAVRDLVSYREALATLPGTAREALRLRMAEGKSYEEIAAILDVSTHAAQRMVTKAAAKVRGLRREAR